MNRICLNQTLISLTNYKLRFNYMIHTVFLTLNCHYSVPFRLVFWRRQLRVQSSCWLYVAVRWSSYCSWRVRVRVSANHVEDKPLLHLKHKIIIGWILDKSNVQIRWLLCWRELVRWSLYCSWEVSKWVSITQIEDRPRPVNGWWVGWLFGRFVDAFILGYFLWSKLAFPQLNWRL